MNRNEVSRVQRAQDLARINSRATRVAGGALVMDYREITDSPPFDLFAWVGRPGGAPRSTRVNDIAHTFDVRVRAWVAVKP